MNRMDLANQYHARGMNCAQSVLLAFSDLTHLSEQQALSLSCGFGGGAATGELCGAITGAIMVLGLVFPVEPEHMAEGKRRMVLLTRELQQRFRKKFGYLRCEDLRRDPIQPEKLSTAMQELGLTNHCDIMIVAAVELLEELLQENMQKNG